MKVLSVVVPCYNSVAYLSKCINSLLKSGEGIEILIVNDGSTDGTGAMANRLAAMHPDKIKAIHQENAGHGGAVNTGIANAQGEYFKVVDSDDWVDSSALRKVVQQLRHFIIEKQRVDMVISNFIYDKVGSANKKEMNYRGVIPADKVVTWDEVSRFSTGKYILMHSVIYRIEVLKQCGLKLPKHTFYVDNLYVYVPLPYVRTMYYMDVCIYHYLIGRDEQSVNERNMIRRIDQQLMVNMIMLESVDLRKVKERKKRNYMMHYLNIITTVSSVLLFKTGTDEALKKKEELWKSIRKFDLHLYLKMRTTLLGSIINLPGVTGRKISLFAYKKAQQKVGFN